MASVSQEFRHRIGISGHVAIGIQIIGNYCRLTKPSGGGNFASAIWLVRKRPRGY
jgi:hypothetical protein